MTAAFGSVVSEHSNGVVKRSNPEKNPRRYPEQKREKEWTTEESRIYRPLV